MQWQSKRWLRATITIVRLAAICGGKVFHILTCQYRPWEYISCARQGRSTDGNRRTCNELALHTGDEERIAGGFAGRTQKLGQNRDTGQARLVQSRHEPYIPMVIWPRSHRDSDLPFDFRQIVEIWRAKDLANTPARSGLQNTPTEGAVLRTS